MKSAFLIVAHGNFDMLKLLIKTLDYKNNDLFIHIDKKCGEVNYSLIPQRKIFKKVQVPEKQSFQDTWWCQKDHLTWCEKNKISKETLT